MFFSLRGFKYEIAIKSFDASEVVRNIRDLVYAVKRKTPLRQGKIVF